MGVERQGADLCPPGRSLILGPGVRLSALSVISAFLESPVFSVQAAMLQHRRVVPDQLKGRPGGGGAVDGSSCGAVEGQTEFGKVIWLEARAPWKRGAVCMLLSVPADRCQDEVYYVLLPI